jgi:cobalt-zinc-cadmium resistance protein CzcA
MALDQSDVYVMLKPVSEWPQKRTKDDLITAMRARLTQHAPGAAYSFSQPIQMRMQELMEAGVRSDIALKIYGEDLAVLREKANQVASVLQRVSGAEDVRAERVAGLPYLRIRIRREAIARRGLNAFDVLDTVEALGGKRLGVIVEGNRRFTMQVRFQADQRSSEDAIRNLKVGDSEDTSSRSANSRMWSPKRDPLKSAERMCSEKSVSNSMSGAVISVASSRRPGMPSLHK